MTQHSDHVIHKATPTWFLIPVTYPFGLQSTVSGTVVGSDRMVQGWGSEGAT